MRRLAALALVVPAFLAVAASPAFAQTRSELTDTDLVTRNLAGGLPNGPSGAPAISGDAQDAELLAFESSASDLVEGDVNGLQDVFMIRRAEPFTHEGPPWVPGATELVSRGFTGEPANGRSWGAAVDGQLRRNQPRCVAFVSEASNLVPEDTNRVADAFVYDLRRRQIERVSVSSREFEANGPSIDVSVNGDCSEVAFSARATNLAGRRVDTGVSQVFLRALRRGRTELVSRDRRGRPGDRDSLAPDFAALEGREIVFQSKALNFARRTRGRSQIYLRKRRGPLRLVTADRRRRPGAGDSTAPVIDQRGTHVAYETRARNLVRTRGRVQVARATLGRRITHSVSSFSQGQQGNRNSRRPDIGNAGRYVIFDTDATNLRISPALGRDMNGVADVFLFTYNRDLTTRLSRNSASEPLALESREPSSSYYGNYIFFTGLDPLTDLDFAGDQGWTGDPAGIRSQARRDPRFRQIYQRYLGPA